ncbi:hypothetical protein ABBQ38_005899 [Trebouxia sp. C0009 RCD-2024]
MQQTTHQFSRCRKLAPQRPLYSSVKPHRQFFAQATGIPLMHASPCWEGAPAVGKTVQTARQIDAATDDPSSHGKALSKWVQPSASNQALQAPKP